MMHLNNLENILIYLRHSKFTLRTYQFLKQKIDSYHPKFAEVPENFHPDDKTSKNVTNFIFTPDKILKVVINDDNFYNSGSIFLSNETKFIAILWIF